MGVQVKRMNGDLEGLSSQESPRSQFRLPAGRNKAQRDIQRVSLHLNIKVYSQEPRVRGLFTCVIKDTCF